MRASTLFAVTIAILLGLAAAITVKVTGYFSQPATVAPAKPVEINVLVAARNIYKGDLIDAPWVRIRPLRADELKEYELHKDKYMPPVAGATSLRIAAKYIETDKPILRDDLEAPAKPESLSTRLLPNMRAVNVSVPKEQSVGGLIQVGEWVDVLLTTQITTNGTSVTRTATIAHKQRVIAKRNSLWPIFAALPDDKPVHYTLEMNPYRASLIEFCKTKGALSLIPVSSAEQKTLEEHRVVMLQGDELQPVAFAPNKMEDSAEYQDEDDRVDEINRGERSVGPRDLIRIFGLQTVEPPHDKELVKPITVVTMVGNRFVAPAQFNTDGSIYEAPNGHGLVPDPVSGRLTAAPKPINSHPGVVGSQSGIDFSLPDFDFRLPGEKKGCQNCKKKKEAGAVP